MSVTFGNVGIDVDQVSGTTSYTNDGDLLIVDVNSTTNDVTAMTYNGVSMTQLLTYQTGWSSRYHWIFYLTGAAQGANNIVTTGGANWQFSILSVNGEDTANPISDSTTGTNTTSDNPTVSITTTNNEAFVVAMGQMNDVAANVSAGANTTVVQEDDGGKNYIFRSTNAVSPAGAFTINVTDANIIPFRLAAFAINPSADTGAGFFTLMG